MVTAVKKSKAPSKFVIDATKPAADGIFDVAAFEKYLHDRIKVENKTNNLTDAILITRKDSIITLQVAPQVQFAKRYIKYLGKKFLKKNQLRDWLRIVANTKQGYEVRYYNIAGDEEEDDE